MRELIMTAIDIIKTCVYIIIALILIVADAIAWFYKPQSSLAIGVCVVLGLLGLTMTYLGFRSFKKTMDR